MAIKLGNTDASLYLGSTPVAAYLGAVQVYSASATLYFNAAVDGDWATVANWWLDDEHTQAAGRLPAAADSVIATANIDSNSGGAVTVVDFTIVSAFLSISTTVTGMATFDGSSGAGSTVTVSGNATFNDSAYNEGATVTGNATFNDASGNGGTITGNATFNGTSGNSGTVTGNATFNDSSQNYSTVTGTATFTGSACNDGGTAGTFVPNPPPSC
jgi:hypothetical protein